MRNTPLQKQLLILQIKNADEVKMNKRFSVYNDFQGIQLSASIVGKNIENIDYKNKLYNQYHQKLLRKLPVMEHITKIKITTNIDTKYIHEALTLLQEKLDNETEQNNAYKKNSLGILSYEANI